LGPITKRPKELISNKQFPEARKLEDQGLHQVLFRWSPDDFRSIGEIWNGSHPEDGKPLRVEDGIPAGHTPPSLDEEPQLTAPGVDMGMMAEMAKKLGIV
jgi:Mn-containing catalase